MPPNDPQFNIGETPEGIATVQRAQLAYPLDAESLSTLKLGLESIQKEVIIRHDRVTFTLASGATTFDVASNYMVITGDGGANTVATIGGGREGMTLTLEFIDANVTITDVSSAAVDTVNLNGSSVNFTSAANVILQLQHDGISWRELARSTNVTADHGGLSGLADDDHTQYITDIKTGRVQVAINTTTDITVAHGLSRAPKLIEITAMCNTGANEAAMSFGRGLSTTDEFCLITYQPFPNGGTIERKTTSIIFLKDTSDVTQFDCDLKTIDTTNFVLNVTTNANAGSTRNFHWTTWA